MQKPFSNAYYLFPCPKCELDKIGIPQFMAEIDINQDGGNYYTSASDFLMGSCHLFALALHEKFGYTVYEIIREKDLNDPDKDSLIHAFCKFQCDGVDLYVDVRGITSEYDKFMDGVILPKNESYAIRPRNLKKDIADLSETDIWVTYFARHIIDQHPKYYSL